MKIVSVIGTRPEAIKMAPVLRALSHTKGIESIVCITGQHRFMLEQVLTLFDIKADHDLDVMVDGQTLNGLSARILERLDPVLEHVRPQRVLVHGDTTTAMAAALAAFHRKIPVGHVEAGLRTGSLSEPWPEEFNRRMVDVIAEDLFAPTEQARDNLVAERLAGRIHVTGNTVIDALQVVAGQLDQHPALREQIDGRLPHLRPGARMVLVTSHRRENFGPGLENICEALIAVAQHAYAEVVYPVHLNPQVRIPVERMLGGVPGIHLIAPQDYLGFVRLMQRSAVVLTDSGGVQEEAPSLGKPVLVMRDVTERPEAVRAGTVRLVGTDAGTIKSQVARLLDDKAEYQRMARCTNPYGDGRASERIVAALCGRSVDPFVARSGAG